MIRLPKCITIIVYYDFNLFLGSNFDISIKNKHRSYPDPHGPLKLSILLLNLSIVELSY